MFKIKKEIVVKGAIKALFQNQPKPARTVTSRAVKAAELAVQLAEIF